MNILDVRRYYSREEIRNFLIEFGKDREVVGVFDSGSYSQRPNVVLYSKDILAMVNSGVLEFHSSLERWSQPMSLRSNNYEKLRKGWDMIFDIDCELFEHGKIAGQVFIWGLRKHGIRNFSIKFTGGTGFHLGIPWECIPKEVDYKASVKQFPDLARKIIMYLKDFVRERLERELFKKFSPEDLAKQVNKPLGKILTDEGMNPYEVVDVDPILISPRHLFRMPYSLNKNTFLVSLPLKPFELDTFERNQARPDKIRVDEGFLDKYETDEAGLLISEAVDWWSRKRRERKEKMKRKILITRAIPKGLFPPCIKTIFGGLADGRKRSLFILLNFLRSVKWDWNSIEKLISEWNEKNKPPLRENYIRGQIRWHKSRPESILPPNCFHPGWYSDFEVCKPDEKCKTIKNPVNYATKGIFRRKSEITQRKPRRRKKRSEFDYPVASPPKK
jgi:DNA primase catalytic subunit